MCSLSIVFFRYAFYVREIIFKVTEINIVNTLNLQYSVGNIMLYLSPLQPKILKPLNNNRMGVNIEWMD